MKLIGRSADCAKFGVCPMLDQLMQPRADWELPQVRGVTVLQKLFRPPPSHCHCAIRAAATSLPARITTTTIWWGWSCCALSPEKLRQEKHGASLGGNERPHTLTQQVLLRRRMVASSSAPTAHGDPLRGRLHRHISAATCTCPAPTRAQARIKPPMPCAPRDRDPRGVSPSCGLMAAPSVPTGRLSCVPNRDHPQLQRSRARGSRLHKPHATMHTAGHTPP